MLLQQYIEKAKEYMHKKEYDDAIECWAVALALNPVAEMALKLGRAYYEHENYDMAIKKFEESVTLPGTEEDRIIAIAYKATCYARKKHYERAIEAFDALIKSYPWNKKAVFKSYDGKGYCYYYLAKNQRTECEKNINYAYDLYCKALDNATEKYEIGMAYTGLGWVLASQGKNAEAIDCFLKANDMLDGKWKGEVLNGLALALSRIGEKDEARSILKESRKIFLQCKSSNGFGENLMINGIIEKEEGKLEEAFRYLIDAEKKYQTEELYKLIAEVAYYLADKSTEKKESAKYLAKYYEAIQKLGQEVAAC